MLGCRSTIPFSSLVLTSGYMEENHDNQHLDSRKDIIPLISILYWPLSVLQLSDSERRQPIENPASLTFLMQLSDSGRCPLYDLKD